MVGLTEKYLFLHGSIVILLGLLSGLPFWLAIIHKKTGDTIRAWSVAHSTLILDGLMIVIIGLLVPHLPLSEITAWVLVSALVSSGYGFFFALAGGAWMGYRGLTPQPYGVNTILFGGHVIGALGSLIGIAIVIYGCFEAFY